MLDRRATIITWSFLMGVIVLEGWGTLASFHGRGPIVKVLMHYVFGRPAPAIAWILGVIVALVYAAYSALGSPVIRRHMLNVRSWRPFVSLRIVAAATALVSGFFEEAVFRKTIMDYALHLGANGVLQVVISALAFGAVHAIWGLASGNLRGAWNAMAATSTLGAALAVLYLIGGRAIGPCIAAHILINLLLEPWLIMTAATNGWTRRSSPA